MYLPVQETHWFAQTQGLILGSGRPLEKEWQPTPVFLPGNPMDRGPSLATVHGVAKSQTQLSD